MIRTGLPGRASFNAPVLGFLFVATLFWVSAAADGPAKAGHYEDSETDSTRATVRGVVRDPDGRQVPGARVIVSGPRPNTIETVTDANGRFELGDLTPGRYDIRVVMDGFTAEPLSVEIRDDSATPDIAIPLTISALSESLVVSAAQVDLPLSETASSITVVSGKEIEARQIRSVGEALRNVPGLSIVQSGGLGSLTSLLTRGGESDFTLVLIDGVRANSFGGGVDLSQLPLVNAERIEIVRGPQSAVFGSDAIGGVVQIVSRRDGRERLDASVEGGGLGSIRSRAVAGGGTKGWSVVGQAEHARSDGFTGIAPATGERVSNDDARARHGGGTLGWRSPVGLEIRGHTQLSFTERGFPGPFGSNPIGSFQRVDRVSRGTTNRRQFGGQWLQPWTGASSRVRQRTDVSVSDFDGNFVSPFGFSESESRRTTLRTQTDLAGSSAVGISAGLEVMRERTGSTFITGTVFQPVPITRLVAGYFGELRYSPASQWSLAAGLRVERIRRDALESNPSTFSPRPAFPEEAITSANPKISLAYLLRGDAGAAQTTRVRASAGTGIRPPDGFEIAFTDNPSLKPERSRSLDVGVQQTFARGVVVVEATGFFNSYDDLIVSIGRSFRDASRYRTDNVSNAQSRGFEIWSGVRPSAGLDLHGSYTFLDTEILSVDRVQGQAPTPYRVGEALIRRPRHQGSLTLLYSAARVTGFADLNWREKVRDIEPTFGASGGVFDGPGYAVLDLGGALRVMSWFELFARIDNVSAGRYEEAFGFPAPGKIGFMGLRFVTGR